MDAHIPQAAPMVIALRAYAEPPAKNVGNGRWSKHRRPQAGPSAWTVIFDTETRVDASQALRFGSYQVRKAGELSEAGLFHDAAALTAKDMGVLTTFAEAHGLKLISRDEFAERIFYGIGYELRATIVGFNLPFDLARIAIGHGIARGEMRGGFTFRMSDDKRPPWVQVKHLSQRQALVRFRAPFRSRKARSERQRGDDKPVRRGFFVDIKTLAGALYSRSFDLAGLAVFLKVVNQKLETEEHGKALTPEYVAYGVRDVEASWDCYRVLTDRYASFGLDRGAHAIFSEASIGKAYLSAMKIRPWREMQPAAPTEIIATAMATYYGGRAEVRIRRELRQVVLCDFLAMYPTVCTLMRLWPFVIGQGMTWRDATDEVRAFLDGVNLAELQRPETWPRLHALVQLAPDADILPTRAPYAEDGQATIGLNYLSSARPLWYTLADAIASKVLTGRAPRVLRAIVFEPGEQQPGLAAVNIVGNPAYRVDPLADDFFKRLIELRQETKARRDAAIGSQYEALDAEQNALKIAANATAYGIFAETIVKERAKRGMVRVHSAVADPYEVESLNDEEPGRCFHPLLAALITGAARLMLAITERLIADEGLEWAFCDTDSMAVAKPDFMLEGEFHARVGPVVDWFAGLNPYDFGGSILKVERQNFAIGDRNLPEPLFCWAVSAKRYVLFNLDPDGRPVIRKASAHGLGHLRPPYTHKNPSAVIPAPTDKLSDIGAELWQHDVWWAIASAALAGHPDHVDFGYHPTLSAPAVSRYGATTPRLLKWMATFNQNLPYDRQIRPFGFLLCFFADPIYRPAALGEVVPDGRRGRRRRARLPKPIAPFDRDSARAARHAIDRETGEPVPAEALKSYRKVLGSYGDQSEAKFLNGHAADRGSTRRRHVRAVGVRLIGKEANRWEEQYFTGLDEEAQPDYGEPPADLTTMQAELRRLADIHGTAAIAKKARVSWLWASRVIRAVGKSDVSAVQRLVAAAAQVEVEAGERIRYEAELITWARERADAEGMAVFARRLGLDAKNLAKVFRGERRASPRVVEALWYHLAAPQ